MAEKRKVAKKNTVGLWRGNPGNRGGTGRPSMAYQERCRWLAEKIVNGVAVEIAGEKDHPQLVPLLRLVDGRGFGKVSQPITVTLEERLKRMHEILAEAAKA